MKPQSHGPYPFTPFSKRPKLTLPGNARVALWVIPNVEVFALDEPIPGGSPKTPDVRNFAVRDYGNRVGIFRLAETLAKFGIKGTVALNSNVCDAYPDVIEMMVGRGWEFMGHNQTNSRQLNAIPADQERDVIFSVVERISQATGKRPRGWLGSGLTETWNSLDYLVEAGIEYCCDWCVDDQPFLMNVGGKRMVSVPYSLEINDLPQITTNKYSAAQFGQMIKDQFDVLYREGADSARVMAIALHPFVISVPHRIGALESALAYILQHPGVWVSTGSEILDNYLKGPTF